MANTHTQDIIDVADAERRADGRGDYYVTWDFRNVSGGLSKVAAAAKRTELLGRGVTNLQVLKVVEDWES